MSISNPSDKGALCQGAIDERGQKWIEKQSQTDEFTYILSNNANDYVNRELVSSLFALASPPSNNMGGNLPSPPLFLPRCEKSGGFVAKQKTKIDWLGFTSAVPVEAIRLGLQVLWPDAIFSKKQGGISGYPDVQVILVDGVQYGLFAYGAKTHNRAFVSLTGVACKTLTDELIDLAYQALVVLDARLSRLDICLDFYHGERTYEHALFAYDRGDFKSSQGGVNPRKLVQGGCDGFGKNLGRTLNVGKRGGEKMIRIYEKGLEVYANLPADLREMSESRALAFDLVDKGFSDTWLRLEVEFSRQKKERDLPLEMLIKRDEYFSGAYPYCADALGVADGLRPVTLKTQIEVDLIKMIGNMKRSYGSLVHTLKELQFSDTEVVQHLTTGVNNSKLVKSGMLLKIKEEQARILATKSFDQDADIPF